MIRTRLAAIEPWQPSPNQTMPEARRADPVPLEPRPAQRQGVLGWHRHELRYHGCGRANQTRLSTEWKSGIASGFPVSPDGTDFIDKDTPSGHFALSCVACRTRYPGGADFTDGFASSPVWSPDGRHIAYCAGSGSGSEQVIVMKMPTAAARPLTADQSALVRGLVARRAAAGLPARLSALHHERRWQRAAAAPGELARSLAWSPDGTMVIAFEGGARLDDRLGNGGDIWIVNADGSVRAA